MKGFLTKNIGLKIASIIVAVIIWAVVVNVSNPEIKATKGVQVEVLNEDVILNAGKTYEFLSSTSIAVNYSVRTRDAYKISASDFKAYVDMNDLYAVTGSVPITVEVVNNKDLILEATPNPSVLRVNVEDVVKLTKNIEYEVEGEPQDGYTVGSVDVNPSSITITGPASVVGQIKAVKIVIDVTGINEDITGVAEPLFVDSIGRTIDLDESGVKVNHSTVNYTVNTLIGKTVPVQYNVSGTTADGYSFAGISASIDHVAIRGSKAALAEINSIVVPASELNLKGTNSNLTFRIDLSEYIPDNLEIVGENIAEVTLLVEGQEVKHYTISSSQIAIAGGYAGCDYEISPASIDVALAGLKSDLETLDPHTILGSINVSDIVEEGTYSREVQFTLPAGYALKEYSPVTVKMTGQPSPEDIESYMGTVVETDENGMPIEETETIEGQEMSESETEAEGAHETSAEHATEKATEHAAEKATEKAAEHATEHATEKTTEKKAE